MISYITKFDYHCVHMHETVVTTLASVACKANMLQCLKLLDLLQNIVY